jgi:hypothetical protein
MILVVVHVRMDYLHLWHPIEHDLQLAFSYASAGLVLTGEDSPSDIAFTTTMCVHRPSITSSVSLIVRRVGASTTAGTDVLVALLLCYKFIRMDRASVPGGSATS